MHSLSVVVPVMDERDTIFELVQRIESAFVSFEAASLIEIIFVDDGSRDDTWMKITQASQLHPIVSGVKLRANFGKAAALEEGIKRASGTVIITMDGDLQDDPKEIPRFIEALDSGFDVVSGWKKVRHDPMGKTLPSKLFNAVTARVSGVRIHDFNCGFKAYRREIFDSVSLYGELHRFIPALAYGLGYKVSEIEVQHHPRKFGKSKYGVGRLFKGFLDLLTVVTITQFNSRPGHLFGGFGIAVAAAGLLINLYLLVIWLSGLAIGQRPLLALGVLLVIVGIQFVLFGMMAELIVSQRAREQTRVIVAEEVNPKQILR